MIEITRRIEREAGSAYRINGREARARDIKILFEDAATGARSPALVRQGQIGEIVNAKPEQRRRILEDAAGVAGLHSRRHEAELRLKAAEKQPRPPRRRARQLDLQIESLKRQARQARRYKELSERDPPRRSPRSRISPGPTRRRTSTQEEKQPHARRADLARATEAEAQRLGRGGRARRDPAALARGRSRRGAAVGRIRIERDSFEKEADRRSAAHAGTRRARRPVRTRPGPRRWLGLRSPRHGGASRTKPDPRSRPRPAPTAAEDQSQAADYAIANRSSTPRETAFRHHAPCGRIRRRARRQSWKGPCTERRRRRTSRRASQPALEGKRREVAAKAPDADRHRRPRREPHLPPSGGRDRGRDPRRRGTSSRTWRAAHRHAMKPPAARLAARRLATEIETLSKLLIGPFATTACPPSSTSSGGAGLRVGAGRGAGRRPRRAGRRGSARALAPASRRSRDDPRLAARHRATEPSCRRAGGADPAPGARSASCTRDGRAFRTPCSQASGSSPAKATSGAGTASYRRPMRHARRDAPCRAQSPGWSFAREEMHPRRSQHPTAEQHAVNRLAAGEAEVRRLRQLWRDRKPRRPASATP